MLQGTNTVMKYKAFWMKKTAIHTLPFWLWHQSKKSHRELLLFFPIVESIAVATLFIVCNVDTIMPSRPEACCCSKSKYRCSDWCWSWNCCNCRCSDSFINSRMLSTHLSVWYGTAEARLLIARFDVPVKWRKHVTFPFATVLIHERDHNNCFQTGHYKMLTSIKSLVNNTFRKMW